MIDWLAMFRSRRLGETALVPKSPKLPKQEERVGFGTFGTFGNAAFDEAERPTPVDTVPLDARGDPCAPCRGCDGRQFWRTPIFRDPEAVWRCLSCDPPHIGDGPCDACYMPAAEGDDADRA